MVLLYEGTSDGREWAIVVGLRWLGVTYVQYLQVGQLCDDDTDGRGEINCGDEG